jgi:hypothetical protein
MTGRRGEGDTPDRLISAVRSSGIRASGLPELAEAAAWTGNVTLPLDGGRIAV